MHSKIQFTVIRVGRYSPMLRMFAATVFVATLAGTSVCKAQNRISNATLYYTFDNGDTQASIINSASPLNAGQNDDDHNAFTYNNFEANRGQGGPVLTAGVGFGGTKAALFNPWQDPNQTTYNQIRTDDYIDAGNDAITYSMYAAPSTAIGQGGSDYTWLAVNQAEDILLFPNGQLRLTINNSLQYYSPVGLLPQGSAHFIGVTANGNTQTVKFYVDGTLASTITNAGLPTSFNASAYPTMFGIGQFGGVTQYQGVMDDIYVNAGAAISDSDMAQLEATPEPGSAIVFLALGLPLLARRRRRRT